MVIQVHTQFRHDCQDFPEGFERPYTFAVGAHTVPDDIGEYFIRAGWASLPDEEPVIPDPTKPVFVQPDNGVLGSSSSDV